MNKMLTAVAQLAERGKLSFEDTIGKHLSDYPNKTKVTIHQLLMHTSGMGIYQNEKFLAQVDLVRTITDLLSFYVNEPLAFEPGTKREKKSITICKKLPPQIWWSCPAIICSSTSFFNSFNSSFNR